MSYHSRVDIEELRRLASDPTISVQAAAAQLHINKVQVYSLCAKHGIRWHSYLVRRGKLAPVHEKVVTLASDPSVSLGRGSAELDVSECTLRNYLLRHGIKWVKCGQNRVAENRQRASLFVHLWGYHLLTEAQIGRAFLISRERVRQVLYAAGKELPPEVEECPKDSGQEKESGSGVGNT